MIPYYIALLRQFEPLCIGLTLLLLRCLYTGERLQDMYPESLRHWGWYCYFGVLWFVVFPCMMIRSNMPHYGIWGMLYEIHPWIGYIGALVSILFSGYVIYLQKNK